MESNNDEIDGNNEEMDINKSGKDKKRKTSGDDSSIAPIPTTDLQQSDDDGGGGVDNNGFLTLTLASFTNDPTTLYPIPTPPPPPNMPLLNPPRRVIEPPDIDFTFVGAQRRMRRNPGKTPPPGKSATIPPPFPWSDTGRAAVRSLNYLRANRISRISGDVQCKKCEQRFKMEFDLERRFKEVTKFIAENKNLMHHRAPKAWMSPALPKCSYCNQENSVRPVIAEKKRAINWLFLLLGQMMGCCTLDQLKYFCKHTKNHRTGAKDRVLFLAYLGLCRQLDPSGPFEL